MQLLIINMINLKMWILSKLSDTYDLAYMKLG